MTHEPDQRASYFYVPPGALCLACDYPLQDLTLPRCPECGHPFDPGDRRSMNLGRPMPALARRLLRPARWLPTLATAAAWPVVLMSAWMSQQLLAGMMLLSVAYVLARAVYTPRQWLRNRVIARYRQPPALRAVDDELRRRFDRRFLVPFVLVILHVPFLLCWSVSHHWLHGVAYDALHVIPATQPPAQPTRCGVIPIRGVRAYRNTVEFDMPLGGRIAYRVTSDGRGVCLDLGTFWR